jgi:hypothetical protein
MIATIRLEAIGDAYRSLSKMPLSAAVRRVGRIPRGHASAILNPKRPWVARITGLDPKFGFEREFLKSNRDYREANGTGTRGVYLTFVLREGAFYEVHELLSWNKNRRYFCRAKQGSVVEVPEADVRAHFDPQRQQDALQDLLRAVAGRTT